MQMKNELFFKHPALPFAEYRYSKNSGRHYKPHMHKAVSIGAIDHGEVTYQVGRQSATLRPGSLALVNPEILHSCNPANFCERSYYMLYLDVDWCLKLQQSLWRVAAFCPVKIILLKDDSLYHQYIKMMELLIEKGEVMEKEQALAGLVESVFLRTCEPATEEVGPSMQVENLKQYLNKNLHHDLSLSDLAAKLKVNPYTMLRHFKASTSITPHAYRMNCRIELARKLLQQGVELSQVALECGFFDQSHFHRHFKAITTVTPKEYQVNFVQ